MPHGILLTPQRQPTGRTDVTPNLLSIPSRRPEHLPVRRWLVAVAWASLFGAALPAHAQWHVVLHTVSHHFHPSSHSRWNDNNWGLGLRRELGETTALQAGAYHNSNFETSAYLIGEWLPLGSGPLRVGVFGGAVSGYKVPVAAGLVVRAHRGPYSAALRLVPKAYESSSAVASLELGYRF